MRFVMSVIGLLLFLFLDATAQVVRFDKVFDLSQSRQYIGSAPWEVKIEDTTIIFSGATLSAAAIVNPMIGKLNLHGDTMWVKTPLTAEIARPVANNSLIKISPDKYLQVSVIWDTLLRYPEAIVHYPFFHFFNSNGDSLLSINYRDTSATAISRWPIMTALSGEYIFIGGVAESHGTHVEGNYLGVPDSLYIFLSKYDTMGNLVWTKLFYPQYNSMNGYYYMGQFNLTPARNGGVLMSLYGRLDYAPDEGPKASFLSFDSSGTLLWNKLFRANTFRNAYAHAWITRGENDSVYYFLTNCATIPPPRPSSGGGNSVLYFGKINHLGDTLWTKIFADTIDTAQKPDGFKETYANQIKYFNNKLYITAKVYYEYQMHPTLVICDTNGQVRSYREYYNFPNAVIERTPNDFDVQNGRIAGGGMYETTQPHRVPGILDSAGVYGWMFQVDSLGCLEPGCEAIDSIWHVGVKVNEVNPQVLDITVYPNPARSSLHIKTDLSHYQVRIWSMEGKILYAQTVPGSCSIDISRFPAGAYLVSIQKGTDVKSVKFIKSD
jgi:hypothetical protein